MKIYGNYSEICDVGLLTINVFSNEIFSDKIASNQITLLARMAGWILSYIYAMYICIYSRESGETAWFE